MASLSERYFGFFTMHPIYLKTLADKLTECSGEDYALGCLRIGNVGRRRELDGLR